VLHFIGDKSRSQLSQRNTRKFEQAFLELAFLSKQKKSLAASIKKACYLFEKVRPGLQQRLLTLIDESTL
jgi:hypothetical protein